MCFEFVNSSDHKAKECKAIEKCELCDSSNHLSVMHIAKHDNARKNAKPLLNGGERTDIQKTANSRFTDISEE